MLRMMPRVFVVVCLALAGCATPLQSLEQAREELRVGQAAKALRAFDRVAARKDASATEKTEALVAAAHACDVLKEETCARTHLERAIVYDVPGAVEPALFDLAERLRLENRDRAMTLYYRAAGGAQKYRNGGWPYQAAMDRIVQLSLSR